MPDPKDIYGSFGSVPDLTGGGATVGQRIESHATGADFGAQAQQAEQEYGKAQTKVNNDNVDRAAKFAAIDTEAQVNDNYANRYVPAAAELRSQFDQLQGQDKIKGYDTYLKGLQDLNNNFVTSAKTPYERQLTSGLIKNHIVQETFGAKRELVGALQDFSNQASADKIKADVGYAALNYNDPLVVAKTQQSINATIDLQHIDAGMNPDDPTHAAIIDEKKKEAQGTLGVAMINSAVSRGDAASANQIRRDFSDNIPGYQQLAIDKTLHVENVRQNSTNAAKALQTGKPLPAALGAPPAHIQAVVADTAHSQGVDANQALTVAWIESSMGQNVGKRGDIGQTGKGGDIPTQAANMVTELKKSKEVATTALGRDPEGWEVYTCYQQGAGGGAALLKAASVNPTATAVDVLAPLYKTTEDALSAVVNNGGNASMTAADFLGFIKNKYDDNAARALCQFPSTTAAEQPDPEGGTTLLTQPASPSLGDAIMAPHTQTGEAIQPSASPREALNNFDNKYPQMLMRANQIPNIQQRDGVIRALERERSVLAAGSTAYSSALVNKAQQLANDPSFQSMDQVPADMTSALLSDHPDTIHYLELRAQQNLEKASGGTNKDMKEYGPEMFNLMVDIHSNKITSTDQLMAYLPGGTKGGGLTLAGYDRLIKEFTHDPETQADAMMKTQSFKAIKSQISAQNEGMDMYDPKGENLWSQALPKLLKAIDDGRAKGLTMGELTDPTSPNWIGNAVQSLKRSPTQMNMDMIQDGKPKEARTFSVIYKEYKNETNPAKRAALKKEAEDLGLVRRVLDIPAAPVSE